MTDYTDKVFRGAAFLDEHDIDWHNNVNLEILNQQMNSRCVVAQAFGRGNYWGGMKKLGLPGERDGDKYGFNLLYTGDMGKMNRKFEQLTEDWRKLILARREADTDFTPNMPAANEATAVLTRDMLEDWLKLLDQIGDPDHTLDSVQVRLGGVLFSLEEE